MAIIGTFTRTETGYTGRVTTLTGSFAARFVKIDEVSDKAPQFRALAGTAEIGAAWERHAEGTGEIYLSVRLDDPSFPAPINAALFEGEGGTYNLVWNRPAHR